jgi:subtilisin family serine protease
VRVLNCAGVGSTDNVVKGIEWVILRPERAKVMTLSLGVDRPDRDTDDAVARAVAAGVIVAVAAGNSGVDACGSSPAAVPGGPALTRLGPPYPVGV